MQRKIVPDIVNNQDISLVPSDITVRQAAEQMAERHIGALLVGKAGQLEGIFTERDVMSRVVAKGLDPDTTQIAAVMTRNPDTVKPEDLAVNALSHMHIKGYRHLPVVSDAGVVGIVSIRDLYAAVKSQLEDDLHQHEAFIFGTGYGSG
ncbi:MAG: CBS domain-containing protein [Pseudomonadota bacterium]